MRKSQGVRKQSNIRGAKLKNRSLEGKSMTPRWRNAILFRSFQQINLSLSWTLEERFELRLSCSRALNLS